LDSAIAAIEGKDAELRLLSLQLPPYDAVDSRESTDGFSLDESFVSGIRNGEDQDPGHAVEIAQLLLGLLGATPLRLKARLLMANRLLEQLTPEIENAYDRDASLEAARTRADNLVERRLERLGLNASPEEQAALRKRGTGLVMSVEQRWLAVQGDMGLDDEVGAPELTTLDDLTDYEKSHDAVFATVSVRNGSIRQEVASILMPDPDQPRRMLMAQRDPESGKLVPQMRRNRRRYVEQGADGSWQALTGCPEGPATADRHPAARNPLLLRANSPSTRHSRVVPSASWTRSAGKPNSYNSADPSVPGHH
jgi:hypothetical protein